MAQLKPLHPAPKPDGWYRLLDYCIAHADNIYVRYQLPSGSWASVALSDLKFTEVIDQITRWHEEGRKPWT